MNRTLLIVDDEIELCELLGELAQPITKTILYAHNGEEALSLIRNRKEPIDTILSDISMPKKSGVELLVDLRSEGRFTPFIFLTGYGDKEKMNTAIKYGAFDFFDKPANSKALLARLEQALEYGSLLRNLDAGIDTMMSLMPAGTEDREKLREAISAVLLVRKQRQAFFKKSA